MNDGTQEQATQDVAAQLARMREDQIHTWGMLCHLSTFASVIVPFGHIFGPLTVWLMKKDEMPLVNDQGKESMNFQISMTIYFIVLMVVFVTGMLSAAVQESVFGLGVTAGLSLLLMIALGITNLVLVIVASVRSYRGEAYRYPLSIRFIS
ncbi:MAG TPA: DUF4870 domain-containing protein [Bacteroidota bacterium]|nr:DUF4870 domain-containing protein [Bacteroidota bacterium]